MIKILTQLMLMLKNGKFAIKYELSNRYNNRVIEIVEKKFLKVFYAINTKWVFYKKRK